MPDLSTAAIVLAMTLISSVATAEPICESRNHVDYTRKSGLPPDVVAALGTGMAEAGMPFLIGDAIDPGDEHLATRRFVYARQVGCRLQVEYEYGGRGHGDTTIGFEFVTGRWIPN